MIAQVTVTVTKIQNAFASPISKDLIVPLNHAQINAQAKVYASAPKMKCLNAYVLWASPAWTAPNKHVRITAQEMEAALKASVSAMKDSMEMIVIKKLAQKTVLITVNVIILLVPAFVINLTGEKTVRRKVAQMTAPVTDNAWMACVSAMLDLLKMTARNVNVLLTVGPMANALEDSAIVMLGTLVLLVIERNAPVIAIIADFVIMAPAFV